MGKLVFRGVTYMGGPGRWTAYSLVSAVDIGQRYSLFTIKDEAPYGELYERYVSPVTDDPTPPQHSA